MNPENLETVLNAIKAAFIAHFLGITVELYPEYKKKITLPFIVLRLAHFRVSPNQGHGQISINAAFEAVCGVDSQYENGKLRALEQALSVCRFVNLQTWGLPIETARFGADVLEDAFEPDEQGYQTVIVQWSHEIPIGNAPDIVSGVVIDPDTNKVTPTAWFENTPPANSYEARSVWIGIDPYTGPDHIDLYKQADSNPPDLDNLP